MIIPDDTHLPDLHDDPPIGESFGGPVASLDVRHVPVGVLAHSTYVKGSGRYEDGRDTARRLIRGQDRVESVAHGRFAFPLLCIRSALPLWAAG
jgi:hypothetical protein